MQTTVSKSGCSFTCCKGTTCKQGNQMNIAEYQTFICMIIYWFDILFPTLPYKEITHVNIFNYRNILTNEVIFHSKIEIYLSKEAFSASATSK